MKQIIIVKVIAQSCTNVPNNVILDLEKRFKLRFIQFPN
jgi:hypothetical protein